MLPILKPKARLIVQRKWFFCTIKQNDIVALYDPQTKRLLVKRIKDIKKNYPEQSEGSFSKNHILHCTQNDKYYFVLGDNLSESTDSRVFGWVGERDIVGKVIYRINL